MPCLLRVPIKDKLQPLDEPARHVVALCMDRETTARLDPNIVRLGHSHVVNAQQKDTTPRTVASAPLVVSGVTVTLHREPATKVQVVETHRQVRQRSRLRTHSLTV